MPSVTYETTADVQIDGWTICEPEVRCVIHFDPGTTGRLYGPAERCYPPEPPALEDITDIEIEGVRYGTDARLEKAWLPCPDWLRPMIEDYLRRTVEPGELVEAYHGRLEYEREMAREVA